VAVVHFHVFCLLKVELAHFLVRSVVFGLVEVGLSLPLTLAAPLLQAAHHLFFNPIVCFVLPIYIILEIVDCILIDEVNLVQELGLEAVAVSVALGEAKSVVSHVALVVVHRLGRERGEETQKYY